MLPLNLFPQTHQQDVIIMIIIIVVIIVIITITREMRREKISCPPDCLKKIFLMKRNQPPSIVKWSAKRLSAPKQLRNGTRIITARNSCSPYLETSVINKNGGRAIKVP